MCFNHITKLNKWVVYRHLKATDIGMYLPVTVLYKRSSLEQMLRQYGVVYIKQCYGNHGNNVYKAALENGDIHLYYHANKVKAVFNTIKELTQTLEKSFLGRKAVVQQEVPMMCIKGNCFDSRVLLQKNGQGVWAVTNIVSRITNPFFYNTSIFTGVEFTERLLTGFSPADKDTVMAALHDISIKAAAVLEKKAGHLGELSVDFGLSDTGDPAIIEVNGKPQKNIYNYLKDMDKSLMYRRPLEYALFRCGQTE